MCLWPQAPALDHGLDPDPDPRHSRVSAVPTRQTREDCPYSNAVPGTNDQADAQERCRTGPERPPDGRMSIWGTPVLDSPRERLARQTRVHNPLFDTLPNEVLESKWTDGQTKERETWDIASGISESAR